MDLTLKHIDDEVLRKIGRNIVSYQHVELLLKTFLIAGKFSSPADNTQEIRRKQVETVRWQTMGKLISGFLANLVNQPEDRIIEPDDPDKPSISVSFSFGDSDTYAELQEKFSAVVDERNKLVHHLFEIWGLDLSVSVNGKNLENYLNDQYTEIQSTIEYLTIIFNG